MAKKIRTVVTLQLPAGKATPAPPVGTALGPHGINIVEFTKTYNEKTADKAGQIIPAQITIFEDRSFTFILKTPPAADLLRKAAGIEKGSGTPKRETLGRVSSQVQAIAEELRKTGKEKFDLLPNGVEGMEAARWVCVDFGSVVVHIFDDVGQNLPWPTRVLLGAADAVQGGWPWMLAAALGGAVAIGLALRNPEMRLRLDRLKLQTPILGPLARKAAVARSRVESSTGSSETSAVTRSGISVQTKATESQPRSAIFPIIAK